MTSILERRSLRPAIVPGLLVAALALAGCGGGDDDASSANASAGTASTQQDGTSARPNGGADASERQACLEKQGVALPERPAGRNGERPEGGTPPEGGAPPEGRLPGGGGGPPADGERRQGGRFGDMSDEEREKLQQAMEECGGGRAPGANGQRRQRPDVSSAAYQQSINAYVACVRENGYDLPDPDFSGDGPIFDPEQVDQQDEAFEKASAACQSELRALDSRGSGGSSTTPSAASDA